MKTVKYDGTQDLNAATVRFTADWCSPCKRFAPLFDKVADVNDGEFVVLDVDEFPDVAAEFGVMSIPTVFEYGIRIADLHGWARDNM